jgi:hypothetical protein
LRDGPGVGTARDSLLTEYCAARFLWSGCIPVTGVETLHSCVMSVHGSLVASSSACDSYPGNGDVLSVCETYKGKCIGTRVVP